MLKIDPRLYSGPYLVYIRKLAAVWNHFQILADFMDVGTTAFRWISRTPGGYAEEIERKSKPEYLPYINIPKFEFHREKEQAK